MSNCGKCFKVVNRSAKSKVYCIICKSYFHSNCVNLSDSEIDFLFSEKKSWSCDNCTKKKRLSRSNSDSCQVSVSPSTAPRGSASEMAVTMDQLKPLLESMKQEILKGQANTEKELGKSIEHCLERISDNNKLILDQQAIISKQQEAISALQEENARLKVKVEDLASRQVDLEQYSRRNTLEIFGVPEEPHETSTALKKTVVEIGSALGVKINEDGIDACHRIQGGRNRPTTGIIVKFLRRDDPDNLLQKRKVKRDFSTRHLAGYNTDSPIYINLSLAPLRRVLFAKARKLKTEFNFKFVWVDRAGRVKAKKSDDRSSQVHVLDSEADLDILMKREAANKSSSK